MTDLIADIRALCASVLSLTEGADPARKQAAAILDRLDALEEALRLARELARIQGFSAFLDQGEGIARRLLALLDTETP